MNTGKAAAGTVKHAPHPEDEAARRQLATALRRLRRERGMSLAAAAEASGLSRSFIVYSAKEPEFVHRSGGYRIPSSVPGADVRYLATASWPIQPFLVTLPPAARLEGLSHAGTEFVHGIEGTMTMIVDGARYELTPGDTLVIPDQVEHTYLNETSAAARVIGGVQRPAETSPGTPLQGRQHPAPPGDHRPQP